MGFLWFSYDVTIFLWIFHGFPMVFSCSYRFSYDVPISYGSSLVFRGSRAGSPGLNTGRTQLPAPLWPGAATRPPLGGSSEMSKNVKQDHPKNVSYDIRSMYIMIYDICNVYALISSYISNLYHIHLVGGIATPLKNMISSIGMMTFPKYGQIETCSKLPTRYDPCMQ